MWGDIHQLIREMIRVTIFSTINILTINKRRFYSFNFRSTFNRCLLEILSLFHEKLFYSARTRAGIFKNIFKIVAWPISYKKKVDNTKLIAILETNLILYLGYLFFHHLLIYVPIPFKSWEQIWTHKILVCSSLWNPQIVG